MRPHAHQSMLQKGQLVGVWTDLIEQAVYQRGLNVAPEDVRWSGDGRSDLIPGEARRQVLAVVDRLRQTGEQGAVAEEVRTHGDDDIDRHLALVRAGQQQRHKSVSIVCVALLAETEDLFELVYEKEQ